MDEGRLTESAKIILRPYVPFADQAIVYSTWQHGLWGDEGHDIDRPSSKHFAISSKSIAKILSKPGIVVKIACTSDNREFIVGYSVMQGQHIFWVFVKPDYRMHGIGKMLTRGFETVAKPQTKTARALVTKKKLRIKE